ncbi:MAG: hypothetical protein WCR54_06605 [Clostridia bacterium]
MEDIKLLLTYLETEITDGKKSFLGGGVVVDSDRMMDLTKRIRVAFDEISGNNVLANANKKAQQIVAEASARRQQILDNDTIIADAQAIAEKIKNDAQIVCKNEAKDNYAKLYNMLEKVNANLISASKNIDNSMQNIDMVLDEEK